MPTTLEAADKNTVLEAQDYLRRVVDSYDATDNVDGTQQTLNLNFSPEERMRLRKALDTYARTVDPTHDQITERRRAMQKSIESRFLAADKDNNNALDRQEATESLPQVARHFNQVDYNQDGLITIDELLAFQNRAEERKKATEALAAGQSDSKALDAKELAEVVKRKSKQAAGNGRKIEPL